MTQQWAGLPLALAAIAICVVVGGFPAVSPTHFGSAAASPGMPDPATPSHAATLGLSLVTLHRESVVDEGGWPGLNYSDACTSPCYPADPDVATGNGYVIEVTDVAYRIWNTDGGLVLNGSLASLLGTGSDALLAPQVRYDPTVLRWFVSVEDVSKMQIFLAGSESSDPTSTWNVQHFGPPGGDMPTEPTLAVDEFNAVVTTNVFKGSVFQGAQVWVANKTQLTHSGGVNTWNDAPNPLNASLTPADPSGSSSTMYLVSDGNGTARLGLFSVTGSPPGTVTLSGPVEFSGGLVAPPAAVQSGTADTLATGTGSVASAAWVGGTLWAVATVACTPSGDSVVRSCLHLWKLSTSTDLTVQDFNWSSGAGRYDYDPAIALDPGGDIAVVFEESSSSLFPGVYATGQALADPTGTLEDAMTLRAGTGPDNATGACSLGVCLFGNYSGIAFSPLTTRTFWMAGQYGASDYATDQWHTWVGSAEVQESYPVEFEESNLPAGTTWSLTVDGSVRTSNTSTIHANETNGDYTYTVVSPIAAGAGVQYVAEPSSGGYTVDSASLIVPIGFIEQFALSTSVVPSGDGSVSPSSGWFNASSSVSLSAVATPGHAFAAWTGSGVGAYGGLLNPAPLDMNGPITEQAAFISSVTYPVVFSESGLPSGASWSITVNGISNNSTSGTIEFAEANGTYSYAVSTPIAGGPGVQYAVSPGGGVFGVAGAGWSGPVAFTDQFELTVEVTPANAGTAEPAAGWYDAGMKVQFTVLPATGFAFASWQGSGDGSYTGASDPANASMGGPVTEVAHLSTASPSGSGVGGSSIPAWILYALIGGVAVLAVSLVVLALRRRAQPPTGDAASPPNPVPPEPWRESP